MWAGQPKGAGITRTRASFNPPAPHLRYSADFPRNLDASGCGTVEVPSCTKADNQRCHVHATNGDECRRMKGCGMLTTKDSRVALCMPINCKVAVEFDPLTLPMNTLDRRQGTQGE